MAPTATTEALEVSVRPAEAIGLTIPAAESFTQYYFRTLNHLKSTGDASATQQSADPGCGPCATMIATYQKVNGTAGIRGDYLWRDVRVTSAALTAPTTATLTLTAHQGHHTIRVNSTKTTTIPPKPYTLKLTLSAKGNLWTTFDIELEDIQ